METDSTLHGLRLELEDLETRCQGLRCIFESGFDEPMGDMQKRLLTQQYHAMSLYASILRERIRDIEESALTPQPSEETLDYIRMYARADHTGDKDTDVEYT